MAKSKNARRLARLKRLASSIEADDKTLVSKITGRHIGPNHDKPTSAFSSKAKSKRLSSLVELNQGQQRPICFAGELVLFDKTITKGAGLKMGLGSKQRPATWSTIHRCYVAPSKLYR